LCAGAAAQSWSPTRNVEIVVGSAPGGSNDKTGRQVEKMLNEGKLVPTTVAVLNRPGGGSNIAFNYVYKHAGDGHYLLVGTPSLLSNHMMGTSKITHTDFTPIAMLFNDYIVFAVNADSPIKTGRDLIERWKKAPQSVSVGFATTLGSHNHIAAGLLMKTAGANPRDMKAIAFKGSAEAITALLGGHIDLVTTAAGNVNAHVASGKLRVIGVSANQRFPGALASIPTWKEQGVDLVYGGWRAILGPPNLSAPQLAFWENALQKATENPDWKTDLERNHWSNEFLTSTPFRKLLAAEYSAMRGVLVDLGLAK